MRPPPTDPKGRPWPRSRFVPNTAILPSVSLPLRFYSFFGLTLGLGFLAALGSGCKQNVACVFTTGCQGGTGTISDEEASLPIDGEWIVDGRPTVSSFFPSGVDNPGTTPIVVVFSETMQGATLLGAIEVVPLSGGLAGPPVQGISQALASDGRVLVMLPAAVAPLPQGDYLVRWSQLASVADLTGQSLELEPGGQLGNFSVPANSPQGPQVLMTYPATGANNQSETTEVVVVFDRPVETTSVNPASFTVLVDGLPPANNPPATPIIIQVGANTAPDPRAFLYRSVAADGLPAPLGTDAEVEVRLSTNSEIEDEDGNVVDAQTITFDTLPFAAPLSANLMSLPTDAIGLANLTDGDAEELLVHVDLDAAEPNDRVDLFLFGEQVGMGQQPLIALQRSVTLTGPAPILSALFTREDVALQFSDDPDDVRFNDGPVTFAFRVRRGSTVTPVRVLDLDPSPDTIQDPLLDVSIPTISELVGSADTDEFRSDLRGLSIAGRADERLRIVAVETPLGSNASNPMVAGSNDAGLFLASRVDLDVVAGGVTTYTSVIGRDEAGNPASAVSGTYTQVGVVGPGAFTPGLPITVEVFDSHTLQPLPGVRVLVHSDQGDGINFPFVQAGLTLADGTIPLATAGAPSIGAIVTADLAGYDLFTLHGVPSTHLSIPLEESLVPRARASGAVRTTDAVAVALLSGLDRRYDDSRRAVQLPRGFVGLGCSATQGLLSCAYGPESIREELLGARSFFAGDFGQAEPGFQATLLLRAFTFLLPLDTVPRNGSQAANMEITSMLDDPSTPVEERTQELPAFDFLVDPAAGVNLLSLADDPDTTGAPFANVETLVRGLTGSIAVSQALAFDQGGNRWSIRSAMPGAITAGGSLGSGQIVDTDPFVRVEVVDLMGNAAGVRPRLSSILAAAPSPSFDALAVPTQVSPAQMAQTGAEAFTILLTHAIGDSRPETGLYRVDLEDDAGRGWRLWRTDPSGSADVQVRAVDLGDGGGVGLADGEVLSLVSAYASGALSGASFLWTDVEREFELFSRAAALTFIKP